MINYYYEINEGVRVFGHEHRYLAQYDIKPDMFSSWRYFHDEAIKQSRRVWLENANGLTLVREYGRDTHQRCLPREMTWIKLQAKELI